MKRKSNNLDEYQEMTLLKIEHNGYWLAFYGLLIALIVQIFILNADFSQMAGEWIVFMAMCIYMVAECIRNGIWDRSLKPDNKTNLILSLLVSLAIGLASALNYYLRYHLEIGASLLSGLIAAVVVFLILYIALAVSTKLYKKRRNKLEKEPEEVNENE